MTIEAVMFDMGNTIIRYDIGSPEEVFHRVLTSMGIHKSLEETRKALSNAEKEAKELDLLSSYGKIRCEEYWHKWDSLVLKHLDIKRNEELGKIVHSRWFDHIDCTLYPEVEEVLLKLRHMRLKLGLVTTAYEEEISLILDRAGLEKNTFNVIVGADTIKKVKPHPDVFQYAVETLEVKPEETVFVGDSIDADYGGALKAGLQPILLDRTKKKKTQGLKVITNLGEIVKIVGQSEKGF